MGQNTGRAVWFLTSPATTMAEWIRPQDSRSAINRAGLTLASWWRGLPKRRLVDMPPEESDRVIQSVRVLNDWRASHAMPLLTFRMVLTGRARRVDSKVVIAQRMKRMVSIVGKLAREETMKLSQMQDIGGCRAILSRPDDVRRLLSMYRGPEGLLFPEVVPWTFDDYMDRSPKPDGYRGVHIVGRYDAKAVSNEPWNGLRIEIQLRTRLQHAFATAVETVTTFTRQPLKFGAGPEDWRRFFSLAGAGFAFLENTTAVPNTPTNFEALREELVQAAARLNVRQRLEGWASALKQLPRRNVRNADLLLLVLDTTDNTIRVTGFSGRDEANDAVAAIERGAEAGNLDAVLVGVESARNLKSAFPNYYADTHAFLEALECRIGAPAASPTRPTVVATRLAAAGNGAPCSASRIGCGSTKSGPGRSRGTGRAGAKTQGTPRDRPTAVRI